MFLYICILATKVAILDYLSFSVCIKCKVDTCIISNNTCDPAWEQWVYVHKIYLLTIYSSPILPSM